jgi:hypothetical protein
MENNKIPKDLNWELFNYSEYPINMSALSMEKFNEVRGRFANYLDENLVKTKKSREDKVRNWKQKVGLID